MSPLPAPQPSKHEILRSIRNERRRTIAFLGTQPPEAFDVPAVPGWRVREVVAHLITLDRATVTGALIVQILGHGTDRIERWNDRAVKSWADRPVPELLTGLETWGRRFERQMRMLPVQLYRMRLPTIWGKVPGAFGVWIRAYDEFVHRQDIRRALELPDDDVDATAVAEMILAILPYHTMPELPGRTGRVAISVTGEPLPEWLYDLGTGRAGPIDGDEPVDARVSVAATPLIMATAGRAGGFDPLESSGTLTISGDEELARAFLAKVHLV